MAGGHVSVQATRLQVLISQLTVVLGFFFARILSPLFPQPPVSWPGAREGGDAAHGLKGTTTVVTGANNGLGFEIALAHFARGSRVLLACRNAERAQEALRRLVQGAPEADPELVEVVQLDTSSLTSVRQSAEAIKRLGVGQIDYLFINAGIIDKPDEAPRFTSDGLEVVYQTNFLGHFLLINLLLDVLGSRARIVVTASAAAVTARFDRDLALTSVSREGKLTEERGFHLDRRAIDWLPVPGDSMLRYNSSKAMQIVFARLLQRRFDKQAAKSSTRSRTITAYHPGFVQTNIFGTFTDLRTLITRPFVLWLSSLVSLSPRQGAQTALWLAHTQKAEAGAFYDRTRKLTIPFYLAVDRDETAHRLWQRWNNDAGLCEHDWAGKLGD